jgi:predicted ATPase
MLTYIKITGFKSFHNFEMEFTPFTLIAGANASGKSNVFDALRLLSRLAETDLKTAFSEQRGNPSELFTQYGEQGYAKEIYLSVELLVDRKIKDNWGGVAQLNHTRLRYELKLQRRESKITGVDDLVVVYEHLEKIRADQDRWGKNLDVPKILWSSAKAGGSNKPFIYTEEQNGITKINIRQDGRQGGKATPANAVSQTVLGSINSVDFPHAFAAKEEMRDWKFLQLNPEDLREPTRQEIGTRDTMTSSGKNLAAALFRIKQNDNYALVQIARKLNNFLPNFTSVNVLDDKANKQFLIMLQAEDGQEFSSRVLSEGTLRLLALCIFRYDEQHRGLLCFEEPENGIHPFRVKAMAELLQDLSGDFHDTELPLRQVIVNTHSPTLVSELILWRNNKTVSVWLSQLTTLMDEIDGKRIKLKTTKILPVLKETIRQTALPFSDAERKFTLNEVIKYLQTADTENARTELQ